MLRKKINSTPEDKQKACLRKCYLGATAHFIKDIKSQLTVWMESESMFVTVLLLLLNKRIKVAPGGVLDVWSYSTIKGRIFVVGRKAQDTWMLDVCSKACGNFLPMFCDRKVHLALTALHFCQQSLVHILFFMARNLPNLDVISRVTNVTGADVFRRNL